MHDLKTKFPRLPMSFKVQGWQRKGPHNKAKKAMREPMREIIIVAINGELAQTEYARMMQIPENMWRDGTPHPPIIIRYESNKQT